MVFTFGRFVV